MILELLIQQMDAKDATDLTEADFFLYSSIIISAETKKCNCITYIETKKWLEKTFYIFK